MKNTKLRFSTPDEAEAVFYEAFRHCDADVMAGLWADEEAVCVHPGSAAILGYAMVIRSWQGIFHQARQAEMNYTLINTIVSDDLAVHLVAEEILDSGATAAVVLATNVYRRFDSGWLMVEHHASLVQQSGEGRTLQ